MKVGVAIDPRKRLAALRLARLFRTSHHFWLNLQHGFESETLLREIGPELARIEPVSAAA